MTEQKLGLFQRGVQRLAQVFITAVDGIEGRPAEPDMTAEEEAQLSESLEQMRRGEGRVIVPLPEEDLSKPSERERG